MNTLKKIIKEEINNILKEDSRKVYVMIQKKAGDTHLWPSEGDKPLYCFKVPFEHKDIFNTITQKHKSAREWRDRFHWSSEMKMWCTLSKKSADEAQEELKDRNFMRSYGTSNYTKSNIPSKNVTPPRGSIVIDVEMKDFKKSDSLFSFYISDKDAQFPFNKQPVYLKSAKTGDTVQFNFVSYDKDGSDEDIYGANYKSVGGKYKLLIIND